MQYFDIDQLVSTTHNTVNKLFEYKNGGDALMLYFRYIQQRKMQNNSYTFSNNEFMRKATGWGIQRLQSAKKVLLELGFIEEIQRRDEQGKMSGKYIKIHFLIDTGKDEKKESFSDCNEDSTVEAPSRLTVRPSDGQVATNTLIENINTLEENINALQHQKNSSLDFLKTQSEQIEKSLPIDIPEFAENYPQEWQDFILYWTEPDSRGKIRAAKEKTFELRRRFFRWIKGKSKNPTPNTGYGGMYRKP